MASLVQIAIQARSTAAAALRAAGRQTQQLAQNTNTLARRMFALQRQTVLVAGAYRDANGQWRDANGRFLSQAAAVQITTTRLGRYVNALQRAGRALLRLMALQRISQMLTDGSRWGAMAASMGALAAKILIVVGAAMTLLGVLGNILPAVQLIAPAAFAAGAGLAVWRMALSGVADAMKAGIAGDTEEFAEALKKLTPNAASAVRTLVDLRSEWKRTQKAVQESFFAGFRDDAIAVSRALQPVADRWLPKIATAFASARHAIRYVLTEAAKSGQLDKIFAGVLKFFQGVLNSVAPLAQAFLDVAEVASGSFGDIGGSIAGAAQKFADWIREMKDNGKLSEWLDRALRSLAQLKEIAGNVGEMLGAIFKGASQEGETFLEKLNRITQQMADWLNSNDGQALISTLSSILAFVIACEPAFHAVGVVMGAVLTVASTNWANLRDIASGVINYILSAYAWLLDGAAKAFSWIPGLGPKLQAAADQFRKWRDQANEAINGIQKTVNINVVYRAIRIGPHMVSGAQQSGEWSSGIGGRASGGNASGLVRVHAGEIVDFNSRRVYNAQQSERMSGASYRPAGGGATVVNVLADARPASMGAAVGALFNMALKSGQLRLRVDSSGLVTAA